MALQFPLSLSGVDRTSLDSDALLDLFLAYVDSLSLVLYPAQEEAILALFAGQNVILSTPTGSGKSLVATAMHFWSFASGRRSYYTCPIKALVNEKFLALAQAFGPQNVGMVTGDAAVNRDAPIICCTAEILSNVFLREGEAADAHDIAMDEFHYYADRERGVAWQVPLLVGSYSRFLLMSATLGDVEPFAEILKKRTGRDCAMVTSVERPVPLRFEYSETPLTQTLMSLVKSGNAPVYLVCFTQREAADLAQGLLSVDLSSKEDKQAIAKELEGVRFSSPFGKDMQKLLRHGIGIHHAGLLPRYRLLVEKLSQKGLLKVICGTDTLGVGVNVPIRTVLFTKLCKYDGEKTTILKVRDFHQIAGRAGRRGFDESGTVVVQAPEHVIDNLGQDAKAGGDPKKLRKIKKKAPPDRGYVHWDKQTFEKLVSSPPEPLRSSFQLSHGLLLNVLSRSSRGCESMRQLLRDCHESDVIKERLRRQAFKLFRSMVERDIVEFVDKPGGGGKTVRVNVELQEDFSLFQELSLWLLDTLPKLSVDSEELGLEKLSLVEAICENPRAILLKQEDKLKREKVGELKREGVDYEDRMAILEEITYEKPMAEFIYETFNDFQKKHPWLETNNIKPKSIARDLYEKLMSFDEYVKEYGLQRSEGLLLRYLSEVYKVMLQSVPEVYYDEQYKEILLFLKAIVVQVDSSLLDEWERLMSPDQKVERVAVVESLDAADITRNVKAFTIVVRNGVFRVLRALAQDNYRELYSFVESAHLTEQELGARMDAYYADHQAISLDKRARSASLLKIERDKDHWLVEQVLPDVEGKDDWLLVLRVDLAKSRERQDCALIFESVQEIG